MASEKPFRKTGQDEEDGECHQDLVFAEDLVEKWILDGVLGGVGRRQRHRDDEVRGCETKQHEDKRLALPSLEQVFQQCDRALPRIAASSHLGVDWQRAE